MFKNHVLYALAALVLLLALSALVGACGNDDDDDDDDWFDDDDDDDLDDYLNALPDPANLTLSLPAPGDKDLGELAELYQETVNFTTDVNEAVLTFLSWIDEITSYPPSDYDEASATYIWGPWEAGGLYGGEYRFLMTRTGADEYEYVLQGRAKGSEDEWLEVWFGRVDVSDAETARRGIGEFSVDFDAARSFELWMVEEGLVRVSYDTISDGRQIDVEYVGFKPDDEDYQDYVDGLYQYHNHADDSGEFNFDVLADMHYEEYEGEQYALREHFWFNTRWLADGTGRSDALVTDGDLPDIEISGLPIERYILGECWGSDFMRDYWLESVMLEGGGEQVIEEQGIESDCAFEQQLPEAD